MNKQMIKEIIEEIKPIEGGQRISKRLTMREKYVIEERLDLQDKGKATLQQLADYYHVSRERIRQIEAKAMRKITYYLHQNNKTDQYFEIF